MFSGKFSCLKSCVAQNITDSCVDFGQKNDAQLRQFTKLSNATPVQQKFNQISPDRVSRTSKDSSIILETVGDVKPVNRSRDSRVSQLIQQHEEMQQMIRQLQKLNSSRNVELENLKRTQDYVNYQAEKLKSTATTFGSFSDFVPTISKYSTKWKIGITCLMVHFCLTNFCPLPMFLKPWPLNLSLQMMIYSHFFINTATILMKNWDNASLKMIDSYQEFKKSVGPVLSGGSLVFLKFLQCSRNSKIEAQVLIPSGFLECSLAAHMLRAPSLRLRENYVENATLWTDYENYSSVAETVLIATQISNIIVSFL